MDTSDEWQDILPWKCETWDKLCPNFTFHFHALEKEMATHSSILAWRIPGTGAWWAAVYGVALSATTDMTQQQQHPHLAPDGTGSSFGLQVAFHSSVQNCPTLAIYK